MKHQQGFEFMFADFADGAVSFTNSLEILVFALEVLSEIKLVGLKEFDIKIKRKLIMQLLDAGDSFTAFVVRTLVLGSFIDLGSVIHSSSQSDAGIQPENLIVMVNM